MGFTYKLIVTDFNMPRVGGIAATQRVMKYFRDQGVEMRRQPNVVGLTAHSNQKFTEEGKQAGMVRVIAKPLKFYQLEEVLDQYLK